ncbi:MAG: hypothetical protein AAF615_05025, partial [Pseudomonadota bacterium]
MDERFKIANVSRCVRDFAATTLSRLKRVTGLVVVLALALLTLPTFGAAQILPAQPQPAADVSSPPQIPADLTPEMVDGMLARLTDQEIRQILRQELSARAEENAVAAETVSAGDAASARMLALAATIAERLRRWTGEIMVISNRLPAFQERLATAQMGVPAMIGGALAIILAGVGAGLAIGALTRPRRHWLASASRGYWDKVVRTIALGVLQYLPILGFVIATGVMAAITAGVLGPLDGMVWIYQAGVSSAWTFLMVSRRAFAPDAPQIRVAPVSDSAAKRLYGLLRRCVLIGAAGWLLAGFFPNLGFGFGPALLTVAGFGTAVAVVLVVATARNFAAIRDLAAQVLGDAGDAAATGEGSGALRRIVPLAAPFCLLFYIVFAWVYWLALWLEQGQHHLEGPIGLLLLLLVAPIANRMGRELVGTLVRGASPRAERVREALSSSWQLVVGAVVVLVGLGLWGFDIVSLSQSATAPAWADAAFEISVTLLLGSILWRLLGAVLYSESRTAHGAEDAEDGEAAASSRLDTLTPLFRKLLLSFLAVVIVMI